MVVDDLGGQWKQEEEFFSEEKETVDDAGTFD